jgi:hypothetical protein
MSQHEKLPDQLIENLGNYILSLAEVMQETRFHATDVVPGRRHSWSNWSMFNPGHQVAEMFKDKISYDGSGWFVIHDANAVDHTPSASELARMYAAIGFVVESPNDYFLASQTKVKGELKLKVFSNFGDKDDAAGTALKAFLNKKTILFTSSNPRSVIMAAADFVKLFGDKNITES